jgi:CO/xanthine dehydrogenase Mo-binding subunit
MDRSDLIGGSPLRLDVSDKVRGAARYPDDLSVADMLFARVLRSPHPHARVRCMDLEAARVAPGVVAVVSGDDFTGPGTYGLYTPDQPALARTGGKVRYVGDAVAAVAAESPEAADAALGLITVDYDLLPVVSDPRLAALPGAPLVHDELGTNVLHAVRLRHGDIAAGFAAADVVIEGHYTTPFVEHAYLQPESGLAIAGEDGRVSIWVATQWPDEDRKEIAYALGLPLEQVREVVTATGGAFGGREDLSVQVVLAMLALKTRRPVKMVYSRSESVTASTKRHPFDMVYRTGATRDGKLTAMEIELVANAGAYASTSKGVLNTAVTLATGPYEVPHVSLEARVVHTNAPPTAAMRGFGANQPAFATEMVMSKLAVSLGMDPAALRRLNLYRDGSTMLTGQVLGGGVGVRQALDAAVEQASARGLRWSSPHAWHETLPDPSPGLTRTRPCVPQAEATSCPPKRPRILEDSGSGGVPDPRFPGWEAGGGLGWLPVSGKRRGVGIACGFKNVGFSMGFDDHSGAVVEAYPDRAVVKVGAVEVGQGSTTALAQLAASKLELPLSAIQVITSDTDCVPDAGSSSASRHTFVTGNAVLRAADEAARRLADLGPRPSPAALPVVARSEYHACTTYPLDPETGQSERPNFTYGYGCQVVEVEVDVGTGETRVIQAVAAHDVGQTIHHTSVEGQIQGGYLMGQGYALLEEYVLNDGIPRTTSLATVLIPTIMDAPESIVPVIVEEPDPDGPYGAKGVGEMTMLPSPGAIAAAVHDAIGVWIDDLPITPERVLSALGKAGGSA